jgi:hypothetical protein
MLWLQDAEKRKILSFDETKRNNLATDARERDKNRVWELLEREKLVASAEIHQQTLKMNDQMIQSQDLNSQLEKVKAYVKFRDEFSGLLTAAEARDYVPALEKFIRDEHFKTPDA